MNLIQQQQKYLTLRAEREKLEKKTKELRGQLDSLESLLAEEMAAIGQPHTVVDGQRLTVRTTPRVGKRKDVSMDHLCKALVEVEGLEFLVRPNVHAGSLQTAMKEIIEETGSLPPTIRELVQRWDQTVVAVTKV